MPHDGCFPQTSQTAAIVRPGYQRVYFRTPTRPTILDDAPIAPTDGLHRVGPGHFRASVSRQRQPDVTGAPDCPRSWRHGVSHGVAGEAESVDGVVVGQREVDDDAQ